MVKWIKCEEKLPHRMVAERLQKFQIKEIVERNCLNILMKTRLIGTVRH